MPLPARILVPTDFSDSASAAQDYALALAAALGARLHVLHVIPDRPFADDLGADEVPELFERAEQEVRARLESWSAGRQELDVMTDVTRGMPDATIVRYADAHGIDLIVIGGSGHRRLTPPRLGHVTVGVLQTAHCPVLTVDDRFGGSRTARRLPEPS